MNKLYATIQTDLVDPELEAKVDLEVATEPAFQDIPTDLYAAITTNAPVASGEVDTISPETRQFSYVVPNRLYSLLVPEKPAILAEERIFVYVPKATYNTPGIAKFDTEQFNVYEGEVSIKQSYLTEFVLTLLSQPNIIIIVTALPTIGVENKIYLVPNGVVCQGYLWDNSLKVWLPLGTIQLDLNNYYTKTQTDGLISEVMLEVTANKQLIVALQDQVSMLIQLNNVGLVVFDSDYEQNNTLVPTGTVAITKQ